ncbi:hypothetical protein PTKIN_Ptkin12aG0202300 [Pterospermum kingtungense]
MAKSKISDSESEESESEEKLSEEEGEEEEEEVNPKQKQQGISEYEKQRLSRIAENRARMEALGLSKMASSLLGSSPNSTRSSGRLKGKRKVGEDDEDYRPEDDNEDDDDNDDDDDKVESDDDDDDDDDFTGKKTPRKNKVKSKGLKPKKKAPVQKQLGSSDYIDDDDELIKAIALSLQDSGQGTGAVHTDVQDATFTDRKGNARLKRKKSVCFVSELVCRFIV